MFARSRWQAASLAFLLVGVIAAGATACEPAPAPDTYVALGDSNASGPLIPDQITAAGTCLRSTSNWAHLVSPKIAVARLDDRSCSGATTASILGRQSLAEGTVAPQIDAVDARTKVITLTIGGNDIGFADVAQTCVSKLASFQTCKGTYVHDGRDELAERVAATAPKVDRVLTAIKAKAPQAKVIVVGYLPFFSASAATCAALPVFPGDAAYLRDTQRRLNDMLAQRARAAGVVFLAGVADASGHDACQPSGTNWVEGVVPSSAAAPLHANAAGHRAFAALLVPAIRTQLG